MALKMIRWMTESAIILRRYPDPEEEPDLMCLEIRASNAYFALRTNPFYCGTRNVEQFGAALSNFPVNSVDRPGFSIGNESADDLPPFLSIAAYVAGARTALRLRFKERGYSNAFEGVTEFSIPAETAAINRLGALMQEFSKLNHCDLHWTPYSGELFAEPQGAIV